ncbi:MAG: hypothetical protein ACTSQ8_21095 [Candidatus Helarchaeota archaeon]
MKKLLKKIKRWSSRQKIFAINDKEVKNLLSTLDQLEPEEEFIQICFICGKQVNVDNIQLISSVKGAVVFCCDNKSCVQIFAEEVRRENRI